MLGTPIKFMGTAGVSLANSLFSFRPLRCCTFDQREAINSIKINKFYSTGLLFLEFYFALMTLLGQQRLKELFVLMYARSIHTNLKEYNRNFLP